MVNAACEKVRSPAAESPVSAQRSCRAFWAARGLAMAKKASRSAVSFVENRMRDVRPLPAGVSRDRASRVLEAEEAVHAPTPISLPHENRDVATILDRSLAARVRVGLLEGTELGRVSGRETAR